jgi:hypothetical protein
MRGEMPIPEPCYRDTKSFEMLRAWVAEGGMHVSLNIGVWDRPDSEYTEAASWGILLADLAHHVANALQKDKGTPQEISLREIEELFLAQLKKPPTDHPGDFYIEKPKDA